jgi:hypothetical protein
MRCIPWISLSKNLNKDAKKFALRTMKEVIFLLFFPSLMFNSLCTLYLSLSISLI